MKNDELLKAIQRFLEENETPDDRERIRQAIISGILQIVEGNRNVSSGGSISHSLIITGDSNKIILGNAQHDRLVALIETLNNSEIDKILQLLNNLKRYISDDCQKLIQKIYNKISNNEETQLENNDILAFFNCYKNIPEPEKTNAQDFITELIQRRLTTNQEMRRRLLEIAKNPNDDAEREICEFVLSEPRIRKHLTKELPWRFAKEWPMPSIRKPNSSLANEQVWLETNRLEYNPFDPIHLQYLTQFLDRVKLPKDQEKDIINSPSITVSGHQLDNHLVTYALFQYLPDEGRIPVLVPLTFPVNQRANRYYLLRHIVRIAGKEWLALIAEYPIAFSALEEEQQGILAEWLLWTYRSSKTICYCLWQAGLSNNFIKQHLFQQLENFLLDINQLTPNEDTFLSWLTIHPPKLRLMLIDQNGDTSQAWSQVLSDLTRAGIEWIMTTPSDLDQTIFPWSRIKLKWSVPELKELLDLAVATASKDGKLLHDLIEVEDPDKEKRLMSEIFRRADGSFERCLNIFQRALTSHLKKYNYDPANPEYRFLNEDDLRSALSDQ
ncbi:hypothetical protein [Chloroflexus sp.]|uniref:hypothetical protein n=1 Tax=Chloroflexus sp. TaxID=1904827 RepID=UPI002FD9E230